MTEYIPVLAVGELGANANKAVEVQGKSILICHTSAGFYAVLNRCSHQAQPLEGGRIRGQSIFCPMHGACFHLPSGEPKGTLTRIPLQTYATRVVDGWVEVALSESED
ncbi:MAG: Rieske 2Fe-2S domain-containing protein [Porticoccaceae bacterium]